MSKIATIVIVTISIITMGLLNYPLDAQDKEIIRKTIRDEIMTDVILSSMWDKLFYYKTVFEDIAEDLKSCTPGTGALCPSTGVNPDGLVINTEAATTGDFGEVEKTPLADSGLNWGKQQRLRIGFRPAFITAQTIYMVRGSLNVASHPYYGFKVTNATLTGVVYDGSSETVSGTLATLSADTSYVVEARYTPTGKIVFFVDGNEKGIITSGLPSQTNAVKRGLYDLKITTNANAGKTLTVAFLEYIQEK